MVAASPLCAIPVLAIPVVLLTSSFGCGITIPNHSRVVLACTNLEHEAERLETHALQLAPEDVLILSTSFGSVEVAASSSASPELRATVRANGRTAEEAQAILARYELKIERRQAGPHVELVGEPLRVEDGSTHMQLSARVDYVATVPAGTRLDARSGSGDVVTRGPLGPLELDTGFGSIRIDEARGDVRAKSGSGDVHAARIEGGEASLESGFGSVHVQAARAKRLTCESGSGDIRIDSAEVEALELETGFGSVHVARAHGALRAHSGSGDVRLHGIEGSVEAESDFGTVEVDGVLSALEAESGSGDVRVEAAEGSRVEQGWKLTSGFGQVVLKVPAGFQCVLDAKTGFGSIDCDFPVTTEAGKKKGDNRLKGTIGSGGGIVTLSSGSGDVALKKTSR